MRFPYFLSQLLYDLGLLIGVILLSAPIAAQDSGKDTTTQNLPESPFSPPTPSYSGNSTNSCIPGYANCGTIGHSESCCSLTQVCTLDSAGRVGCCEFGVKCVGEIPLKTSGAGPRWGGVGRGGVGLTAVVLAGVVTGLAAPAGAFGSVITGTI